MAWVRRGQRWKRLTAICPRNSHPTASAAVCIRSTGLPETHTIEIVFGLHAKAIGIPQEQFQKLVESMTHRKRSSTLEEVANAAIFLASDRASGMTGTVANLTGGMIVD